MSEPKLKDHQARFEQQIRLTASRITSRRYAFALENFFSLFPKKRKARQFRVLDVQFFVKVREQQGIRPSTVKLELSILRAFWNFLIEQKVADYNPVAEFLASSRTGSSTEGAVLSPVWS
jgi:site-specific recombinase XerD